MREVSGYPALFIGDKIIFNPMKLELSRTKVKTTLEIAQSFASKSDFMKVLKNTTRLLVIIQAMKLTVHTKLWVSRDF